MTRLLNLACLVLLASCSSNPAPGNGETKRSGATIEGVVREQGSDIPVAGVTVFLVRSSNQPQLHTSTDGDGRFSLDDLDAGRHLVGLVRDGYVVPNRMEISGYPFRVTADQHVTGVVFHLVPAGTISGHVLAPDGKPASHVEVQLLQNLYLMGHQQWSLVNRGGVSKETRVETNERGEFRAIGVDPGQYALRFVPHEASVEAVVPGGKAPSAVLYPGVRDVSKAAMIDVKPGRETLLDDLKLTTESRGWIRLALANESGERLENFGSWNVKPVGWIGAEYPLAEQRVVNAFHEIQPDMPGTYDVTAMWSSVKGPLVARLRVNYQGADISEKMALHKPESTLKGSVVILEKEDAAPKPFTGAEVAIGPDIPYFIKSGPDGSLALPSLYSGRYKLGATRGLPADAFVVHVMQGSRNILKEDLDVAKGETMLDVVVSSGAAVAKGKVADAKGQPVQNALVALVPESPLKDRVDYYGAYQSMRTDQNGGFEIHGLTPGSYQAYAWLNAPAAAFRSDAFMKAFAGKGTAVKLDKGGTATLDLKTLDSTP